MVNVLVNGYVLLLTTEISRADSDLVSLEAPIRGVYIGVSFDPVLLKTPDRKRAIYATEPKPAGAKFFRKIHDFGGWLPAIAQVRRLQKFRWKALRFVQ